MVDEELMSQAEKPTTYRERVLDAVSVKVPNKTVPISFPHKTFKRFSSWALENANDCYWLAIEKLLDNYENKELLQNQLNLLAARDEVVLAEIARLDSEISKLKVVEDTPEARKTFGKKE